MSSETSTEGGPIGNTKRATQYRIKYEMEKLVNEASSKREGLTKLQSMCKAQIEKAEEGDTPAFNVVADRMDGKPAQAVALSGPDGGPVQFEKIVRQIVRPPDTNG